MTYSVDFRKKVLSIKTKENLTLSEVSKRFGVGQASVVRWSKDIEPQRTRHKPTTKMDGEALAQDVNEHPDSYQYERAARFGVSQPGIAYALKKLTRSRKKNVSTPQSRPQSPAALPNSNS